MPPDLIRNFGPFRLDTANAQLWCETQPVRLTAKALQVLSYLAERPGQLVTKDELFAAVWPDTVVSDATLTSNIQAVRQVLGDDSHSPQYIETVHRRGFRFIAPVAAAAQPVASSQFQVSSQEEGVGREENQKSKGKNQKAKGEETEAEVGRETEHTSLPDDGLLAQ
ncbi:MAG: transcriptional regulator, partial [Deltaproteobacteria bacterium]|nr:transcriptional regulator [Deltaproteobacteria bacterium]